MCPNTPGAEIIRAPTESSIKEPVRSRRGDCSYSAVRTTLPSRHYSAEVCGRSFGFYYRRERRGWLKSQPAGIRIRCNNQRQRPTAALHDRAIQSGSIDRWQHPSSSRSRSQTHPQTRLHDTNILIVRGKAGDPFSPKEKKTLLVVYRPGLYVARRKCRQGEETYSRRTCVHLRQWQWYPAQSYKSFGGRFGIFASAVEACKW